MAALPDQHPEIWAPLLEHSGLDDQACRAAVALGGTDPLLWFRDLGSVEGMFDRDVPTRVQIADDIVERFEQDHDLDEAQQFLQCKILHETIHWGRFQEGLSAGEGPTQSFERAAYGRILRRYWQDDTPLAIDSQERIRRIGDATLEPRPNQPIAGGDGQRLFTSGDVREGMPTGIRNNNPGNIKRGDLWKGLAESSEMKDFQQREQVFCVFREPEWGLRAMAIILRRYQRDHGLKTLRSMIGRWAPAEDDNPVNTYANFVAEKMGIEPDDAFDFTNEAMAMAMMKGMIPFENGAQWQPYADVQFEVALRLT